MGRPKFPEGEVRNSLLHVRLRVEERVAILKLAFDAGLSVSEWARQLLLQGVAAKASRKRTRRTGAK